MFEFLYKEKYRLFSLPISTEEAFVQEAFDFADKYGVGFEINSEGIERVLSTIYLIREYLNQEWKQIYQFVKEHPQEDLQSA